MSRRDPGVRLRHMLLYTREALELSRGRTRADLDTDRMLNLALTRLLEIIGEAAARVPPETKTTLPGIPWPEIVGLRNRLIHGYDNVNFDILWAILVDDLPVLIAELERVVTGDRQ